MSKRSAAAVALFLFLTISVFAAPAKFDIPAQLAPDAIKLFMKQSGARVAYVEADLKNVTANALVGEYEPAAALAVMLKDTGFIANAREKGWFIIVREEHKQAAAGSVRGNLVKENGAAAERVMVVIRETGQQTTTDRNGEFSLESVEPGNYMLVATADGYRSLRITDVVVKAGSEVLLSKEELHLANGTMELEPFVVRAETVTQLEKVEVTDTKAKPFTTSNVDLPRGIDDAQPYTIFDAKTIERSGAINIEDFLKDRLTMNATAQTNRQSSVNSLSGNPTGNTSAINLRGLGENETLVLVNGRRMAGVSIQGVTGQPDLNGIPINTIDRIEVLPSSASGIYGGSAVGGVVNIILKNDFAGGEIRATYDNTTDSDSPTRTVSLSYGAALEGGKTHVMLTASWSDSSPLLLQDRAGIVEKNIETIQRNFPNYFYGGSAPFTGSVPNIANTYAAVPDGTPGSFGPLPLVPPYTTQYGITAGNTSLLPDAPLRLKNGVGLNSNITHIAAGTSPTTSLADLSTSLAANQGAWDFTFPGSTQSPTGLFRPFGSDLKTKSFLTNVRRQILARLEAFVEFSYNENRSHSVFSNFSRIIVPADAPTNPFTSAVAVSVPDATALPVGTNSLSRSVTAGLVAQLPWNWTGEFDYTWSDNRYNSVYYNIDTTALNADVETGVFNPFVDSLRYPLNVTKYSVPNLFNGSSAEDDFALRGSGPLGTLPWGAPTLTFGLERRFAKVPLTTLTNLHPLTPSGNSYQTFYPKNATTDSGYAEATVPLVKRDWLPAVHTLELQLSGRSERYTVDAGTDSVNSYPNQDPPGIFYSGPTLDGLPYFSRAHYTSTNYTVGVKYQPVPEFTVRASRATAFLPPTPDQLALNPVLDDGTTTILDPVTGNSVDVQTRSGGNPQLKPQSSKSTNVGFIWEPRGALQGLRLDAEYYKIDQFNAISSLDAQTIVKEASSFPGRVTRDALGNITLVDTSYLNLFKLETEGWDLSGDYALRTPVGMFNLHAAESIILHLKTQYSQVDPLYDAVNFPSEGGAAKYKSNATLTWDWRAWTVAWTSRFTSSYKQYGALGGPSATESGGVEGSQFITEQGGNSIPSQLYHDLFVSYAFGRQRGTAGGRLQAFGPTLLDGVTLQLGIRNVFDKVPPFDAYYAGNYYYSPYGDIRLRSYWLTLKKAF